MQFQKCKKALFAFSKMAKKISFFAPEKSLKLPKMQFLDWKKNRIFGSFKPFSGAKIDFFAIFEVANNAFLHFWNALLF